MLKLLVKAIGKALIEQAVPLIAVTVVESVVPHAVKTTKRKR